MKAKKPKPTPVPMVTHMAILRSKPPMNHPIAPETTTVTSARPRMIHQLDGSSMTGRVTK